MDCHEYAFDCPLRDGLHARPASQLAQVAARFSAEITLVHERSGSSANAKSALAIIATEVRRGDRCRIRIAGADAGPAHAALREFLANVLPGCDEPAPAAAAVSGAALPRPLRDAGIRWHAGRAVSPGIGQGMVVVAGGPALPAELPHEAGVSREQELDRARGAIAAVRAALEARLAAPPVPVEADIVRAHLAIATDVALLEKIAALVAAGRSAGQAIVEAAHFFAARLKGAESVYVRERAVDLEDICLQLLEQLHGARLPVAGIELTRPSVVAAETLSPRQLLALDRRFLEALVLERGGATSHAVVLARSFAIPTLTGVARLRASLAPGQEAIVDADRGVLVSEVTAPVRRYYERERRTLRRRQEHLASCVQEPAVTRDGRRIEVGANVATADELGPAFAYGADGVGLFRTEMLFLDRDAPPAEEEQLAVYVRAVQAARGRPVIIRTFDLGGDKPVPYLRLPQEANPFLGYRGIRIYPEHREVFLAQLRAVLRASAFGRVWVMVPMVCAMDEVHWVRATIAEARGELAARGVAFAPDLPVGIMVEVPSVAFLIDQLAAEVDFFSIGTNDLAQYFLAADRDNDRVAGRYGVRHPAFLRLLVKIVDEVHRHGRWVGMCGEMARSVRDLPLLIGLGLDEISAAAPEIPALKAAIARSSAAECRALLERATACRDAAAVEEVLAAAGSHGAVRGLLDRELVAIGSDSASQEEAVQELVDAFFATGRTDDRQAVEEAIWAREAVYSTGLGHGFAIPHCKTDAVTASSIGVVRLREPVAWSSVDGRPVECVILLAIRESDPDGAHLKVFSLLARRLMHEEFRRRMLAAPDPDAVVDCLAEELGIPKDQVS